MYIELIIHALSAAMDSLGVMFCVFPPGALVVSVAVRSVLYDERNWPWIHTQGEQYHHWNGGHKRKAE